MQTRDFVHVDNIVDANLLACGAAGVTGEVFNVGSGQETSLLGLLDIFGSLAGRTVDPLFHAARPGDIRRSYSDTAHAQALLTYRPAVSLADGLRETFAWYRAHERWLSNETLLVGKQQRG